MVVADIRANILAQASNGMVRSNSKLAGEEVSELALPSDYPLGGLSEDGGANAHNGH